MFDARIPASMVDLPGRTHTIALPEDTAPVRTFPHGNAHPVKRTHAERKQQMAEYYQANRARLLANAKAKYAAMSAEKREARLARMRATTKRIEAERAAKRAAKT